MINSISEWLNKEREIKKEKKRIAKITFLKNRELNRKKSLAELQERTFKKRYIERPKAMFDLNWIQ
jgi:hypothetical protein